MTVDCSECGSGTQGVLVTFPDETTRIQLEDTLAKDFATDWQSVNERQVWFKMGLVFDCLPYWTEFYATETWQAHRADLGIAGTISVHEEISFSELGASKPTLWVEDIIRGHRIRMMMQPIVDVAGGRTYGYEMLARGVNEDGSVVSPLDLYASARQQSQLFRLDRACRIAAVDAGSRLMDDGFIFINFVPTSIYIPEHCLTTTIAAVERVGLDRSRIVFEVVETDKVQDTAHLKRILSYYRERGFRCALDDFGEGFSDLELLRDLNPDIVKLDRQFVTHIDTDSAKQAFAESTLHYASELGVIPLAEGVERREEAQLLADMGYHLQQGYWYGKPNWDPVAVRPEQLGAVKVR